MDSGEPDFRQLESTGFARQGNMFLWLDRQGTGLSGGRGVSDGDPMARALRVEGVEGRNCVQLQFLEHEQFVQTLTCDASASLAIRLEARSAS
jgi:hypothetical protein